MITSGRTAFRYAVEKALTNGVSGWTKECRLAEAELARRCRNIFFNAIAPVVVGPTVPSTRLLEIQAQTQVFGAPIIVVDALNYAGHLLNLTYWRAPNFLTRMFTTEDASDVDFFGAANYIDVVQMLSHERNNFSPTVVDGPSNKIHFCPYILKPGQIITVKWLFPVGLILTTQDICHEADFRGIVVLPDADPYSLLCGRLREQVCRNINDREPETQVLDVTIPVTSLETGISLEVVTEPQSQPLLVYGFATNINGCQIKIRDQAVQWQFCSPGIQPNIAYENLIPVNYQGPRFDGLPIYLPIANGEITNRDAYHMLAVPHLLEANTSLNFRLTSGLRPNGLTNTFQQGFNTTTLFDSSPAQAGRISALCRTV